MLTTGSLFVSLIFGGIGFVAFVYGKRISNFKILAIGVLLIAYPYFIPNTLAACIIGILLTASLYFFRD